MKNKLKLIRAQKNLTQEQLADLAGISRPALAQIENGKTVPDGETIAKLVSVLHMPAGDIFDDLDVPVKVEEISDKVPCRYIDDEPLIVLLETLLSKLKYTLNTINGHIAVNHHIRDYNREEREGEIHDCVELIVYFARALQRSVKCLGNPVICGNYDDILDTLWKIAKERSECRGD